MPVEQRIDSIELGASAPSLEPGETTHRLLSNLVGGNRALDNLRRALERDEDAIKDADVDRAFPHA